MKAAIAELKGGNTTDQLAALDRLKDLVRPIDNANGATSQPFLPSSSLTTCHVLEAAVCNRQLAHMWEAHQSLTSLHQ